MDLDGKPKTQKKSKKTQIQTQKKSKNLIFFGFKKIKIRGKRFFFDIKTCFTLKKVNLIHFRI